MTRNLKARFIEKLNEKLASNASPVVGVQVWSTNTRLGYAWDPGNPLAAAAVIWARKMVEIDGFAASAPFDATPDSGDACLAPE